MLIDANAYTGHWPFRYRKLHSLQALRDKMTQYQVSKAVISNLDGVFYKNPQPANRELIHDIKNHKGEGVFLPFGIINPIYGGWKDDFQECQNKLGMKGIRLFPKYHGYDLDHPNCITIVKMARDAGLPVALSLRMVDSRPSSWIDIQKEWSLKDVIPLLRTVPDARYLILNVANSTSLDEKESAILQKSDVLMDTSGRALNRIPGLLKTYGAEKFAFGSHSPFLDYCTGLLRIESLRENEANDDDKELMRSGNIARFLNI